MPTYEYVCNTCRHKFEKFQPITDKPVKKCPKCGKGVTRLVGSGAGILFKGSGFYQTDYRSKSYEHAAQKEKPVPPEKSGDSSGKSPPSQSKKTGGSKESSS